MLLGLIVGLNYKSPDVLVNKKMVATKGSDNKLYFLSKQRKNFTNKTWVAQNGQSDIYLYTKHNNDDEISITCDDNSCKYHNKEKLVLFLYSLSDQIKLDESHYVIQLKDFPLEQNHNVVLFNQIKQGYFIWVSSDLLKKSCFSNLT